MNKVSLSFSANVATFTKVAELAKNRDISRSQLINELVENSIDGYEEKIRESSREGGTSLVN